MEIIKYGLVVVIIFLGMSSVFSDVVLYTALDKIHSSVVVQKFEEKHGIKVKPVYDTEATKTAGLVNRLIAEKERPRADVFWNNEIVRTQPVLKLAKHK